MASLGQALLTAKLDTTAFDMTLTRIKERSSDIVTGIGKQLETLGPKFTKTGKAMSLAVTAPLVAMGAGIIKLSADFEKSMNRVGALSGATGDSLDKLRLQARQLGADTQFSASEAADAMGFLAMAGFEVEEIYSSMPDTLNLAAAAQLDMGSAADIVSNIMTGFGIPVSKLGNSVDVLTKAFISSNTDLRQLGEGMKFVGPVASGFGVSIEQTTAALGALSNAGIQGGMAGTTLRGIINTLSSSADKLGISTLDASGKMRPLADIIDDLNESGIETTKTMEVFGLRGGPGMTALLAQGGDSLRKFTEELEDAGGTADRVAKEMQKGFLGQLKEMQSAVEELSLSFGDAGLLGNATKLITRLTGLVRKVNELSDTTKTAIMWTGGLVAAIGPLLLTVGKLITAFQTLRTVKLAFLGPVGILAAAAIGYHELDKAMDAGRQVRADMASSFDTLIEKHGSLRGEIVLTSETERTAMQEDLNRRKRVLEVTLEMQEQFARSVEADVIAFANKGFFGQLFSFGEANVNIATLDQLDGQLSTLRSELGSINTQLDEVAKAKITAPKVDPVDVGVRVEVPSALNPDGGPGSIIDAVEKINIRTAESADELFQALGDSGSAVMASVERLGGTTDLQMQGIETRVGLVRTALERAWDLEDITAAQFDYLETRLAGLLDELAAAGALSQAERFAAAGERGRGSAMPSFGAGAQLATSADAAAIARDTIDAMLTSGLTFTVEQVESAIESLTRSAPMSIKDINALRDSFAASGNAAGEALQAWDEFPTLLVPSDGWTLAGQKAIDAFFDGARTRAAELDTAGPFIGSQQAQLNFAGIDAAAQVAEDTVHALVAAKAPIEQIQAAVDAWTTIAPQTVTTINEVTQGLLAAARAADASSARLERLQAFDESPTLDTSLQPLPRTLTKEQQDFNSGMYQHRPHDREGDGGLEQARLITDASTQFKVDIAQAGLSFADTLVTSLQSGETGKVIQGIFELGGQTLQAAIAQDVAKGAGGALSALGPWGAVIGTGISILGSLFGNAGGQNKQREEEARRAEARQSRSTPAISVTAVMNQTNQFQTSLTDPVTQHALDRQIRQVVTATLEAIGIDTIMQKGQVAT